MKINHVICITMYNNCYYTIRIRAKLNWDCRLSSWWSEWSSCQRDFFHGISIKTILGGHEKLLAPVDPGMTTKHPPLQIAKGASKRISTKYRSSIAFRKSHFETTLYSVNWHHVESNLECTHHPASHYSECFFTPDFDWVWHRSVMFVWWSSRCWGGSVAV